MADAAAAPAKKARLSFRGLSRAIHRDLGHLAVGLTVVYAASGLAVNHIADWEPSFASYQETRELGGPIAGNDDEAAVAVRARLGIADAPRDVYRAAPDDLQLVYDKRTLHVNTQTGRVLDEGQRPRFFLRAANWLHLNRGKKAWTYVADFYAAGLLLLALTGIVLNTGRRGLFGRGGILILVGAGIPVAYVALSGGPEHAKDRPKMEAPRER
ncbi:Hypothetical protein A7982_07563 [Minicystis rosea]|nr:Hypothetical protein A7982_07563 [Minicystis rosea]